jgi:hypothetical protein
VVLKPHYGVVTILNYTSALGGFRSSHGVMADVTGGIPVHRQSRVAISWSGEDISMEKYPPDQTLVALQLASIAEIYICRDDQSWRKTPVLAGYLLAEDDWLTAQSVPLKASSCVRELGGADRKMLRERAERLLEAPAGSQPAAKECGRRHVE